MSIWTKLHERTIRMHLYVALIISVLLFTAGIVFGKYHYVCMKGVEMTLGAVIEFLLFGSID